jgi:hypothetical protein
VENLKVANKSLPKYILHSITSKPDKFNLGVISDLLKKMDSSITFETPVIIELKP